LEPIFDAQGQVIAWLYEQRFVIDLSNRYRAFVRDGEVWSPERRHLGQFANGECKAGQSSEEGDRRCSDLLGE
jgi:hypothetical protein